MKRNDVLVIAQFLLVLLGVGVLIIGIGFTEKFSFIPVLNALALFVVAWTFTSLRRKSH